MARQSTVIGAGEPFDLTDGAGQRGLPGVDISVPPTQFSDTLTDGIATALAQPLSWNLATTLTDGAGILEGVLSGAQFLGVLAEGIGTAPSDSPYWRYLRTLTDGANIVDVAGGGVPVLLEQTVQILAEVFPVKAVAPVLTQGVGMASVLANTRVVLIAQAIGVLQAEAIGWNLKTTLTDRPGVAAALLASWAMSLSSGIGLHDAISAVRAASVIETLGLLGAVVPNSKRRVTLAQGVGMADSLLNFFGKSVSEGVGMASTLGAMKLVTPVLTQGVGMAAVLAAKLVVRVTATDTIGLDDANLLKLLFSPVLIDGVEVSAAYVSPGGDFTTWAMNTRTGAVTEYSNYVFNSFMQMGNKYLGGADDGLYELNGDTDAGTDIIARIKSGLAQFAGSKFTLFKGIYLGVRGEGDFVLRLITGEGVTYDYAVATRNMRTTKVHTGKGLRTRYFAFELISTGQDFDLESIEFVPLVTDRRV